MCSRLVPFPSLKKKLQFHLYLLTYLSKGFFKDFLSVKATNLKPEEPPPYSSISFIVQWVLSNTIVDICTKTPATSKYGNFGLTLWILLQCFRIHTFQIKYLYRSVKYSCCFFIIRRMARVRQKNLYSGIYDFSFIFDKKS